MNIYEILQSTTTNQIIAFMQGYDYMNIDQQSHATNNTAKHKHMRARRLLIMFCKQFHYFVT